MKIIISLTVFSILWLNAFSQDYGSKKQHEGKTVSTYCAMLKDGKLLLIAEGKEIYADINFSNGTILKANCTVEKSDQTTITLKNGDCVDQEGNIIPADVKINKKDKIKQE